MFQKRQAFIDNLNDFIGSCKANLSNVLEKLDWSKESIYSTNHKGMPQGVDTIKEENSHQDEIICADETKDPLPHEGLNHETVGSNPLYRELVESLSNPTTTKQDEKSKTEALVELLKMERDAKRRRINYKNRVHTKNKTHIEIMREVLAEQMATLTQQAEVENSLTNKEESTELKSSEELIEIRFPEGNPYLAWKSVLEMQSYSENKMERRARPYFDERDQAKHRHSDDAKLSNSDYLDRRKEHKRDSSYYEDRSYSKHSSTKSYEKELESKYDDVRTDSKHSHSKYNEVRTNSKQYSSHHSAKIPENTYNKHRHKDAKREFGDHSLNDNYIKYDKGNDTYCKGKKSTKHSDEDRNSRRKHKRDRSHSSSPSSSYKSRKHKSKHQRH